MKETLRTILWGLILAPLTGLLGQAPLLQNTPIVKPGIDVLVEKKLNLVTGKKIGLITNATGVSSQLMSTVDVLSHLPGVELIALFGPEHGVRGDVEAGKTVSTYTDAKTGITVFSLYGKTRRPTPDMLRDIEVLIYDIQDIGSRAYTYIYTMAYAMEEAKKFGIKFIVLDRPNPLGGDRVAGNVLDPEFSSFIGLYPIPYVYGMTVGELAQLFNEEFKINCDLEVVPMEGWRRAMKYDETGLVWIPTSPHVPHAGTAEFVVATGCIGELNTLSVGVGYTSPFELIGAPWMNADALAHELNARKLPGVYFRPTFFKPYYLHYKDQLCQGVQIHIMDAKKFDPAIAQIHILTSIQKLHPQMNIFTENRIDMFDKAFGTNQVRAMATAGKSAEEIMADWVRQIEEFNAIRSKYLIYP
ncbi:MAG: exo-beta-N-acetylmuramidase NamZ family protein [Candidatus Zhuqueibacterota bacterium]